MESEITPPGKEQATTNESFGLITPSSSISDSDSVMDHESAGITDTLQDLQEYGNDDNASKRKASSVEIDEDDVLVITPVQWKKVKRSS